MNRSVRLFFLGIFWISLSNGIFSEQPAQQERISVKIRHIQMKTAPQYRRWDFERVFIENYGIGVTFTEYTYEIISPVRSANKNGRKEIHMRLEPHGSATRPGHLWLKGDPAHDTEDSMHATARLVYRGRDDQGNPVQVESLFSQ